MNIKKKEKSKGNTIIFILSFIWIILLIFIVYQRRYQYWPELSCFETQADAENISAAISEYFSAPEHREISPTNYDIEKLVNVKNPWKLTLCGDSFYIHVIDRSAKCPAEIQTKDPAWHSHIYTLEF